MLASQVSRVVTIPGIIIAASRVKAKATAVFAMCSACNNVKKVPVRAGFAGASLPRVCDRERQPNEAQCPLDSYQIQPEKCEYVDQQTWKLQARCPLFFHAAGSSLPVFPGGSQAADQWRRVELAPQRRGVPPPL